jgi:GNAT superfamily N-acetyltransferase
MQVRRLRATEWSALRELRLKALEDAPDAFSIQLAEAAAELDDSWRERARRGAEGMDEVVIVAQDDSTLIGMAAGRLAEDEAAEAWLFAMWVEPTQRGDGIGEGLLRGVVDWARERGAHRLHLTVTESNDAALSLYLRFGFKPTGDRMPLREGSLVQCLSLRLDI